MISNAIACEMYRGRADLALRQLHVHAVSSACMFGKASNRDRLRRFTFPVAFESRYRSRFSMHCESSTSLQKGYHGHMLLQLDA